jgi:hypothetical protein
MATTVTGAGDSSARPVGGSTNRARLAARSEPTQPDLLALLDDIPPTRAERFERFHQDNPHVYDLMVRLARDWKRRTGRNRLGVAALWERMRWELAVRTTDEAPALNNDHKAFYARLIMRQEPDLEGLFEVRRSVADDCPDRYGRAA